MLNGGNRRKQVRMVEKEQERTEECLSPQREDTTVDDADYALPFQQTHPKQQRHHWCRRILKSQ